MNNCELCNSEKNVREYFVTPIKTDESPVYLCSLCLDQISSEELDYNHFRVLSNTMWSENRGIKVLAYRFLKRLSSEQWAQDLLDMLYLEDDVKDWAESSEITDIENKLIHKDCNGVILEAGDTVTLIKDLNVKGVSFIAKRGTAVRRISLDPFNSDHIEGRVNGQKIVILTQFVKKNK